MRLDRVIKSATCPDPKRIKSFRRALQKQLGRRPTTIEKAALIRAAVLSATAEAAMTDPTVSHEDRVRLDNTAARARRDFLDLCDRRHKAETPPDPLGFSGLAFR